MHESGFSLGILEGFYGEPWSYSARYEYCSWLGKVGYQFYIYAPKADDILRKNWTAEWPRAELEKLIAFRETARKQNIQFGIGFSPFEIYKNYNAETRAALRKKVRYIDKALSPDIFCALFDDMQGDQDSLAKLQVQILNDIIAKSKAKRFIVCPTYYSLDPVLEKLFGPRPQHYFEKLGNMIDPAIEIFWTGQHICSALYPDDHILQMTELFRRKPFLWDNYPVNDVWEMCDHLHLRPFTNRSQRLRTLIAGHCVNPMKQPWLSKIPLASLPLAYERDQGSFSHDEFLEIATSCCGPQLGATLVEDLALLNDRGLQKLTDRELEVLHRKYSAFSGAPEAREILNWLAGKYIFDEDIFNTSTDS